jgi:hypothetical protein
MKETNIGYMGSQEALLVLSTIKHLNKTHAE